MEGLSRLGFIWVVSSVAERVSDKDEVNGPIPLPPTASLTCPSEALAKEDKEEVRGSIPRLPTKIESEGKTAFGFNLNASCSF